MSPQMQVQLDIRQGHAQTVDKVLAWFDEEGGVAGTSVCDCGCGTGSLAIPLALRVRARRCCTVWLGVGSGFGIRFASLRSFLRLGPVKCETVSTLS